MKNMISLDNGRTWMTAAEAMDEINERIREIGIRLANTGLRVING